MSTKIIQITLFKLSALLYCKIIAFIWFRSPIDFIILVNMANKYVPGKKVAYM